MNGVLVLDDAAAVAGVAAGIVCDTARDSHASRGSFRLAVSGGETPRRLYTALAEPVRRNILIESCLRVLFADERAVPPADPASNYAMVHEVLLEPAGIGSGMVARMRGDADSLEDAAAEYEAEFIDPVDLLILGIGADGHTASIFPGSDAVQEKVRRVLAVTDSPKPPPRRLTITPRVIAEARTVLVLATGKDKAGAIARALARDTDPAICPATLMRERLWLLDRDAAGRSEPGRGQTRV